MRKIIAACLLVAAVWVGAEVGHRGVDAAFGGLFANNPGKPSATNGTQAKPRRTMDAFQRAWDSSEQRVDRQLEPPPGVDDNVGQ
ncbi:MAG: hypothetical protein IH881_18635 [Myxococcales bacterium]|nr:hypothetical protein [Myxococcales bacterium]